MTLHVKITGVVDERRWYADLIGAIFEVKDKHIDFVLADDLAAGSDGPWRHIDKCDCEIVTVERTTG